MFAFPIFQILGLKVPMKQKVNKSIVVLGYWGTSELGYFIKPKTVPVSVCLYFEHPFPQQKEKIEVRKKE